MPTATLTPDAILEQTNLSGGLTDVDEDPDSHAGDWMNAVSNSADAYLRVSFPTPPGNPTGTQTFKAYVRASNAGSFADPIARLDLYESGSLLATGGLVTLNAIGNLVSQDFDLAATPLADPTGAGVELRLLGIMSGSFAPYSSVDIDALNWDTCNYTAGYWLVP